MTMRTLRRGSIAAARPAATPTTYTIYANSSGYLYNTSTVSPGDVFVGNWADTNVYEGFLSFDTSSAAGTITSVTLSLPGTYDGSTPDFTLEVRSHDWGASLDVSDWVAPASLGSKTLLASRSTVGWDAAGYNVFTSDAAFLTGINQAGATRLLVNGSNTRLAQAGSAFVGIGGSGAATKPRLVIEATV